MKSLTVIIPTLFPQETLQKCLKSLFPALRFIPKEKRAIFVVNNGRKLKNIFLEKEIVVLQNPKNFGFAKAVNQGIKKVSAQYYLILNDDCFLKKDTIKKMIDFLERNPKFFATQPVILKPKILKPVQDDKGSVKQLQDDIESNEIENIGFYVDLKIAKAYPITDKNLWQKQWDKERFVLGLSATCLLAKGELFEEIGFFDESFHSYLEDVDLSIRCAKNNLPLFPTLSAKAVHLHMASSSKMGTYKAKRDFLNWIRIIKKHYSISMLIKYSSFLFLERVRNFWGVIKKCFDKINFCFIITTIWVVIQK